MASNEPSPIASPTEEIASEHLCPLCNKTFDQPRVLICLHIFCEACIKNLMGNFDDPEAAVQILECPECGQETKLTSKGVNDLPLDYVLCNQLDVCAMKNMQIICTSCKAKEKAVARCSDCGTFLCPNCVTAHQYMRCFENHKVVTFKELEAAGGDGIAIHKPITCSGHPGETMKYYCHTCHMPICNECMVAEHKQPEHHYERANDVEQKMREEIENLITESKTKIDFCEDASRSLDDNLTDLQRQKDDAKLLIQETFHSYKAILEKRQTSLISELDDFHANQEIQVMETCQNVQKTIERIEDACKFAERLLKHGNTIELLIMKNLVSSQMLYQINNTPKPDINVEIKFVTDMKKFEEFIGDAFGHIKKPDTDLKTVENNSPQHSSPLHSTSSFENEGFALPTGVLSPDIRAPHRLDMDLANNVVQYNLAQLVGMTEQNVSRNSNSSSPAPLTLSDLINSAAGHDGNIATHQALSNISALAKLGSLSMNNSRSLSPPTLDGGINAILNGQPVRGSPNMDSGMLNGGSMGPFSGGTTPSSGLSTNAMQNLSLQPYNPPPRSATTKLNNMQIRCKFGQLGPGKGQFSSPHGFCLGLEEEIIVADTNNHRIQVFDKMGEFKYQFGIPGKEEGQLWYPRKVAVIRSTGKYVICDRGNERSRMQIFTKNGHFIKKIAIRYIDIVAGLAITNEGNIVTVDSVSPTVFVISETGELIRWFDCSEYMREPSDIAISGKEYYICDFKGHCVIVFSEEGRFVRRIGCENITNFPNGIDISDAGDVLVGDSHGNRFHVVVFSREGSILSEFECPYVKVSRCCGLKITSEGYVVTLAKNNHHVLILNTLYIM